MIERLRAALAPGLARWRALDERVRLGAVAVVVLVVLALAASPVFAVLAVAIVGAAIEAARRLRLDRPRRAGLAAGAAGLLLVAAHLVAQGPPAAKLPTPPVPSVNSAADIAAVVTELDGTSANAWVAAGDVLPQTSATSPGVVAYERALLIDPGNRRALLRLAAYFSSIPANLSDEAIAAWYTALGGGTPPASPRLPG